MKIQMIIATALLNLFIYTVNATKPYCLYAPDKSCFAAGWPSCCHKGDGSSCPTTRPICDLAPRGYCVYAADKKCYQSGWPACCADQACPVQRPPCDVPVGASYCMDAPDTTCYKTGWPGCCSNNSESDPCPTAKPSCELLY
jgi:hypothetical protein